jgi:hypothetical protein
LLANNQGAINLWRISPASTPSEVFELRVLLIRALDRGDWFYVAASLICLGSALIGIASTSIVDHAVVSNVVDRTAVVRGRLVTRAHSTLTAAAGNVSRRIAAIDHANAPLEELFDFVPDDESGWVFRAEQWNNTWKGKCTYCLHPAVDLVVYPTNSTYFQDEVPLLGNWLPKWATVDPKSQGTAYAEFFIGADANDMARPDRHLYPQLCVPRPRHKCPLDGQHLARELLIT